MRQLKLRSSINCRAEMRSKSIADGLQLSKIRGQVAKIETELTNSIKIHYNKPDY